MRNQNRKKKIFISVIALLTAGALGVGIWYGVTHSQKDPIPVISFMDVGMTEYWGDNMESHGPVSSDNIQTVFLSDTQEVTEVLVKEGDTVKKGDPMMTFDTTLSGLDLERKRLEVEKLKLELQDAEDQLKKIISMKPMETPPDFGDIPGFEVDLGQELTRAYRISGKAGFDGSSREAPMIVWLRQDTELDQYLVDDILKNSLNLQMGGSLPEQSSPSADTDVLPPEPDPDPVPDDSDPVPPEETETEAPPEETEETQETTVPEETEKPEPEDERINLTFQCDPEEAKTELKSLGQGAGFEQLGRNKFRVNPGIYSYTVRSEGYHTVEDVRLEIKEDMKDVIVRVSLQQNPDRLNSCYVVFKTTEGNMSKGNKTLWQGVKLYNSGALRFYDASMIPDFTMAVQLDGGTQLPEFDMGSGMTAAQIAEMRAEQEKKIDELELKVKMADAEYKIKKRELEDGNIYAEFDGKVVSLLTEEESRKMKKPMIKVSGGGGYQIEGSVNELDRENMKIGQKVTVNDWNTGGSYEGEIIAIGEFPIRSRGYNGRGNPNSSYYPFTAFVDGEADLQTGSYVSIQYASGDSENGVYLSNPFIREEKGQSYVFVMNDQERLEKRPVTTGKALWGSYTEITSGLTEEDYLAFPYGKDVKPGAKARIGDMSDFYR